MLDNQHNRQGPPVQHMQLCSMLRSSPNGRGFGGGWIHGYLWLSPFAVHPKLSQHCLSIRYTPMQNKKLKKINYAKERKKENNSVLHVKQLSSALFYFSYICHVYWLQCKKKYFFVCITVGKKSGRECFKERIKSFTPCHSVLD